MFRIFLSNTMLIISLLTSTYQVSAEEHQTPVVASLSEVNQCNLVTTLTTLPAYNKNVDWMQYAIHELLVQAETIGATHLVITNTQSVGVFNGTVNADAYRCKIK